MMPLSFCSGAVQSSGLFQASKNCVLTTIAPNGQPHARRVRVATCSDDGAHLWFVIPRNSGIAADISADSNAMLSVMDAGSQELAHVSGTASLMGDRHSPVYLDPDFQQAQALSVVSDEIDIALLRVDVNPSDSDAERAP